MIDIERAILVSVLEAQFVGSSEEIVKFSLDSEVFIHPTHKLLVKSIERLKELGEPIDTDYVRAKLIDSERWRVGMDEDLLNIMTHQPLGTFTQFIHYYNLLSKKVHQEENKNNMDGI